MHTRTNPVDGGLTIIADVPTDAGPLHPSGYFKEIQVLNWSLWTDSSTRLDATIPVMVDMTMADGARLFIWADGTFVMYPQGTSGESYSQKITADGVVANPFRS